ncbi:MAG: EamA family transporter [Magnetovibrio sp.]|nr:EamA family transporter [Magnetovibrio sp.]
MPGSLTTKGVLYFLSSIGLIALVDTTCKFYTDELHAVVLVWGYFVGITVFVMGYYVTRGQMVLLKTEQPVIQIIRPGFLVLSISGLFLGLTYLPMAEATAIGFTGPLFIVALSVPMLGERVGWHRWLAVVVGLAGVLVIVRPDGTVWHWSAATTLLGAICFAIFQILTRRLAGQEKHQTTLIYTSLAGTFWVSLLAPFFWTPPSADHALMFLIIGAMGAAAHLCIIKAFAHAQASLLAPFNYSKLVWVIILGYLVFGDVPGLDTIVGSAIIVSSGLYVLYREGREVVA